MDDKCFYYIVNLYFILIFLSWFHVIYIVLYFFSFFNFLNFMINGYLSKYFNFISAYNDIFSNFSYYKCLSNNASKHLKMMHKCFLKYVSKHK